MMTKKKSSEILADENQNFSLKRENFGRSKRNRGEIWNKGEMHHCLRGMDAPDNFIQRRQFEFEIWGVVDLGLKTGGRGS